MNCSPHPSLSLYLKLAFPYSPYEVGAGNGAFLGGFGKIEAIRFVTVRLGSE